MSEPRLCEGGVEIGDGPCAKCGNTREQSCGRRLPDPRTARIAELEADLAAERARADDLRRVLDAERERGTAFMADRDRLRAALEPVAKVHINRAGGNAGIAWHAIGIEGSLPALADGEVLYVLRAALEAK
jgi:hypothetical protein